MSASRTAIEIDSGGVPVAVFHRRGAMAWTHAIDGPWFQTTGRGGAIVRLPCPLCKPRAAEAIGKSPGRAAAAETPSGAAP